MSSVRSERSAKELAKEIFGHPSRSKVRKLRRIKTVRDLEKRGRTTLLADLNLLNRAVDLESAEKSFSLPELEAMAS